MTIDSGTTNVVFGLNMTNAIYSLISPDIQPFTPIPGAYGIACSKVSYLPAKIDLKFTSQENKEFTLTIPSRELNVGPFESDPDTCQTLINAQEDFSIIGASALKHYYSVWDLGNQRLGFASTGI